MRAFIHAFQGRPWNEDCEAAYDGFRTLGIDCVLFTTNEELDARAPEDVVVGGMLMMRHVLDQRGIVPDRYEYPNELARYLGRRIWTARVKDLRKEPLPFFVKPAEEKAAKGVVVRTWKDAEEYDRLGPEAEVLCSEAVDFRSEWRCFVRYGEILGVRSYHGDRAAACDRRVIERAVEDFTKAPAGCALDFGVTEDGRTLLIEVNDGMALGCYGLPGEAYARLLSARWAELNGTEDALDDRTDRYMRGKDHGHII